MMKKTGFFIFLLFLTASIFGQNREGTQLALEIDPAPYLLKGYSISLKYGPKKTPKVAYMASVYQSDFPEG